MSGHVYLLWGRSGDVAVLEITWHDQLVEMTTCFEWQEGAMPHRVLTLGATKGIFFGVRGREDADGRKLDRIV